MDAEPANQATNEPKATEIEQTKEDGEKTKRKKK